MQNRPQITRVVLENYKSIAFCDVKLGPLAILVGPNGAGKSNFLDALHFLSDAVNGSLEKGLQSRGGFANVVKRSVHEDARVGFRVEFITAAGVSGYYSLRVGRGTGSDYAVEREKCRIGIGRGPSTEFDEGLSNPDCFEQTPSIYPSHRHLQLPRLSATSPPSSPDSLTYQSASSVFSNCEFYNFSAKDFRHPVPTSGLERVLLGDGTNLFNVLHRISQQDSILFDRIVQYLRVIFPALTSVEPKEIGDHLTLQFHEQNGAFYPTQVSDGTLRALAVLVALFQPAGHVSLVGLEEPEAALHPAAAGVLFDALREASASVQVMATTHSADLLDKKEIDTNSILSVEQEHGVTRIGHVDHTGRQALKEQLYTAGELMRLNYLRPESSQLPENSDMESVLFGDPVTA